MGVKKLFQVPEYNHDLPDRMIIPREGGGFIERITCGGRVITIELDEQLVPVGEPVIQE